MLIADPMQLVDELSMIYTAIIMCYATFSFSRSRLVRQLLGGGLAALAVLITVSNTYNEIEKILIGMHIACLSLPSRSRLSSDLLRAVIGCHNGSKHLCDGSKH